MMFGTNLDRSKHSASRLIAILAYLAAVVGAGEALAAPDVATTVDHFGAIGDNQHDDTTAFNAALSASRHIVCTHNKTYLLNGIVHASSPNSVIDLSGCKIRIVEKPSTNQFLDIEASSVTVRGLYLIGVGDGIQIGAIKPVSNIQILNFTCDSSAIPSGLSQCIYWGEVTKLTVDHPTFISSGYGMLQIPSKPSRGLTVTHATATDMYGDAIEQNGQANGVANDVLIDDFTFNGSHDFPKPATEERFAGFTSVNGLTIINSHVKNANGDACLHFEGTSAHIILSDTVLTDCQVSGGNDGYIYFLTSTADFRSVRNTFIKTSKLGGGIYAFSTQSGNYANPITSTNDSFIDESGSHGLGGFNLAFHTGMVTIDNPTAKNVGTFVSLISTTGISWSGGNVTNATNGILAENGARPSGGGGTDISVKGAHINCIIWCVRSSTNTNGTGAPTHWILLGNVYTGTGRVLLDNRK
jgi:hypothetical protein